MLTRGVPAPVAQSGFLEVKGSILGRDIPKSLKMVLVAPRLAPRLTGKSWGWSKQCKDNVTRCSIMSSVWGMILQ